MHICSNEKEGNEVAYKMEKLGTHLSTLSNFCKTLVQTMKLGTDLNSKSKNMFPAIVSYKHLSGDAGGKDAAQYEQKQSVCICRSPLLLPTQI